MKVGSIDPHSLDFDPYGDRQPVNYSFCTIGEGFEAIQDRSPRRSERALHSAAK
jgi:hypothetical protein